MIDVRVGEDAIDAGRLLSMLGTEDVGAIASFLGIVRGQGGLTSLTLDHYPAMTCAVLTALAEGATRRWALSGLVVQHRTGRMIPGEIIVFVGAASAHRAAALEACGFLIDQLKTSAPFWKKETFADRPPAWVEARAADDVAAARWAP